MDQRRATEMLDAVQARRQAVPAKLLGVPVNVVPMAGNIFKITLSMANENAGKAATRLNDVGADIRPWPPQGHCEADCTFDTALHYLAMTGDLDFGV